MARLPFRGLASFQEATRAPESPLAAPVPPRTPEPKPDRAEGVARLLRTKLKRYTLPSELEDYGSVEKLPYDALIKAAKGHEVKPGILRALSTKGEIDPRDEIVRLGRELEAISTPPVATDWPPTGMPAVEPGMPPAGAQVPSGAPPFVPTQASLALADLPKQRRLAALLENWLSPETLKRLRSPDMTQGDFARLLEEAGIQRGKLPGSFIGPRLRGQTGETETERLLSNVEQSLAMRERAPEGQIPDLVSGETPSPEEGPSPATGLGVLGTGLTATAGMLTSALKTAHDLARESKTKKDAEDKLYKEFADDPVLDEAIAAARGYEQKLLAEQNRAPGLGEYLAVALMVLGGTPAFQAVEAITGRTARASELGGARERLLQLQLGKVGAHRRGREMVERRRQMEQQLGLQREALGEQRAERAEERKARARKEERDLLRILAGQEAQIEAGAIGEEPRKAAHEERKRIKEKLDMLNESEKSVNRLLYGNALGVGGAGP